jgi:putative oxidoreductase
MNDETTRKLNDLGLLLLRVGLGGLMLGAHGWGKLLKLLEGGPIKFADPLGLGPGPSLVLAVGSEVACAALLIVGLGTRFAAAPLVITMLVAAFIVHGDDPFRKQEFAIVYMIPFLTLMATGPGRYSLDAVIARRREARQEE